MTLKAILTFEIDFSTSIDFKVKDDGVYIEIVDEWCGDTESGFGALLGADLDRDQVKELCAFLSDWLNKGE